MKVRIAGVQAIARLDQNIDRRRRHLGLWLTDRGQWRPAGARGRNVAAVEYAALEWIGWFNHRRLLEPIGHIPPAEE